jgi:hypothetical protein
LQLLRPGCQLVRPGLSLRQLLAELLYLRIAASELLVVEAVGIVSLQELPMGLVEMALELLLVHGATDRQDALMAT